MFAGRNAVSLSSFGGEGQGEEVVALGLRRLYDWARRATEQGLARAIWEGLRACRLPPDLPPLDQIRFDSA